MSRIDDIMERPRLLREPALQALKQEFDRLSESTVCEKSELNWPRYVGPRHVAAAAGLWVRENAAGLFRRNGDGPRPAVSDQHTDPGKPVVAKTEG